MEYSILALLNNKATYHLIIYSISVGAIFFQSLIAAPISLYYITINQFTILQRAIFPPYFLAQAIAPVLIYITAPYPELTQLSIVSLGCASFSGLVNLFVLFPYARAIKDQIAKLEVDELSDSKIDDEAVNVQMRVLNKHCTVVHLCSISANIVSILALGYYGVLLSNGLLDGSE